MRSPETGTLSKLGFRHSCFRHDAIICETWRQSKNPMQQLHGIFCVRSEKEGVFLLRRFHFAPGDGEFVSGRDA